MAAGLRVLSTDQTGQTGVAEITNLSLEDHREFTVCGRIITYQFKFQYIIALGPDPLLATDVSSEYPVGNRVFGFTPGLGFYPSWLPGVWTSLCISVDKQSQDVKVNINGENIETEDFDTEAEGLDPFNVWKIFLMNSQSQDTPGDGSITDVTVWGRELSEEEMIDWQHCQTEPAETLLTWEDAQLNITGLSEFEVNQSETCLNKTQDKKYIGYNIMLNYIGVEKFCSKIGGRLAVPRDQNHSREEFITSRENLIDRIPGGEVLCQPRVYTGFERIDSQWVDVSTQEPIPWYDWKISPEEDGYDCVVQDLYDGNMDNVHCDTELCPFCQMEEMKTFVLHGLCQGSSVDRLFVMKTESELLGYTGSTMAFSLNNSRWEIVSTNNTSDVLAFLERNDTDFPIGVNSWILLDTNCSDPGGESRSLQLHLEVEQPGHFCCDDGTCVDSRQVCDDSSDCQDKTDERNCIFLHLDPSVNDTEDPPTEVNKGRIRPIALEATFVVLNIFDINEVDSIFDLHFLLKIRWYNRFLSYTFLKPGNFENVVFESEEKMIWSPSVRFSNVRKVINDGDKDDFITVLRKGKPKLSAQKDYVQPSEVYAGRENPLQILMERRFQFSCSFDNIKNFPFGTQKCSLLFYLKGATNSISTVVKENVTEVGQYVVKTWRVDTEINMKTGHNMTRITMELSRNLESIFMATYLPTLLMNLINQASNYIPGDKYDMIYTINITCMMVLASIYLSVSSSLPVTADIKPVEVWLLFNLAYPFVTILVNIVLQVEINVHRVMAFNNKIIFFTQQDLSRRRT